MAKSDRERWDRRYADPIARLKKREPNALLARHALPVPPGSRALELACGLGRNAIWLAEQGYRVDAIDISLEALRHARAEMQRRDVSGVNFILGDLDHFPLPDIPYDLVMVFRFLDRALFPTIRDRVRPGGLVIYQTFNLRRLEQHPTFSEEHLLHPGELAGFFPGWTALEASDDGDVSTFVGRKPERG
jgi:tellurite methyltransferase